MPKQLRLLSGNTHLLAPTLMSMPHAGLKMRLKPKESMIMKEDCREALQAGLSQRKRPPAAPAAQALSKKARILDDASDSEDSEGDAGGAVGF